MPSTVWTVPMSGVHMALRTLWMRIDLPLNRSSAAVLSDRMATRSSTTLRAIDCGTCFEADDCAVRPREIRGTSSPVAGSSSRIETRSTFITWNVNSTTLSSSRSSSCCLDSSFEISSNSSSFFSRSSSSDLALTFRCAARDAHRQLAHDRAARRFRTGELGRRRRHHLRSRRRGADLLHAEGDLTEGDDVVFDGDRLGDAGAVQEGPVRGAGVLDLHAAVGEGHLGMAAGNGGVVNRDVAGHGAPDDDVTTRLQVDGLLARRAQQLEHRRQIYFTLRPWRAPTP